MRPDLWFVLAAVTWVFVGAGCSQKPAAPTSGSPDPAGPQVSVVKPEQRPVRRIVERPGSVQPFEETALVAKLPAFIGTISDDPDKKDRPTHDRQIDIGNRVKKDQVLADLTIPELDEEAKQKAAQVNEKGSVRPGMYVYARLMAELPAAWAVPAAAVGKVGDDTVLYLVEGGKAVRVTAQLLRGDAQFIQVKRCTKPGAADWADIAGTDSFATPASAVTVGQAIR